MPFITPASEIDPCTNTDTYTHKHTHRHTYTERVHWNIWGIRVTPIPCLDNAHPVVWNVFDAVNVKYVHCWLQHLKTQYHRDLLDSNDRHTAIIK